MVGIKLLAILASTAFLATGFRVARQISPVLVLCGEGQSSYSVSPGPSRVPTIVRSSNYGNGNYGNDEQCVVEFVAEEFLTLKFTFNSFNLEKESQCQWDYLCVHGVDYCSNTLSGSTLAYNVPAGETFTIMFKSDPSVTSTGFDVLVEALAGDSKSKELYNDRCKAKTAPKGNTDYSYTQYDYDAYINDYPVQSYTNNYVYDTTDSQYETDYGYLSNNY